MMLASELKTTAAAWLALAALIDGRASSALASCNVIPAAASITRTGPVVIEVTTDSQLTARIDELFIPGSGVRDDRFPSFLALPPPNVFDRLVHDVTGFGKNVLAAADLNGRGNRILFIP